MAETKGRRVADDSMKSIEEPGDYSVCHGEDGTIRCLWMAIPGTSVMWGRIAAEGHGQARSNGTKEPEWTITEDDEGRITVAPSIDIRWGNGDHDRWHGYLQDGVWKEA